MFSWVSFFFIFTQFMKFIFKNSFKTILILLVYFSFSKFALANEITLLHCYSEPTIQPEIFEINKNIKEINYKESPGVVLDMNMKYKTKSNSLVAKKLVLEWYGEITGAGDTFINDLEKQKLEINNADTSNFDEATLELYKKISVAIEDAINYFKEGEVFFTFSKNLEMLDITYSDAPNTFKEFFGNAFEEFSYYCLEAFMSNPNQPKNWIGFVIKVNDMIYHGEEKRRRMIFPLEQVYASEEQCYDDFGWLFQNDSQLMGRFPQTSDVNESYLFGCTETNN